MPESQKATTPHHETLPNDDPKPLEKTKQAYVVYLIGADGWAQAIHWFCSHECALQSKQWQQANAQSGMSDSWPRAGTCEHCQRPFKDVLPDLLLPEWKLMLPTYNGGWYGKEVLAEEKPEFGVPYVPVIIRQAEGIRVVLGTHCFHSTEHSDVFIERQPNGWVLMVHRDEDAKGYVYLHDNGHTYLQPELGGGVTVLELHEDVPGFCETPEDPEETLTEQLGDPAEQVCACPTCKSVKVRARVWADVNDDKVLSETEDDYWCDACESDGIDGTIPFSPGFDEIPRRETREWREALAQLTKKEDECNT